MEIKINLFAALRDAAGKPEVRIPWKQGMTCLDVVGQLKEKFYLAASLWAVSFVAVNGHYAEAGTVLNPEDEVAVLPPVSGG